MNNILEIFTCSHCKEETTNGEIIDLIGVLKIDFFTGVISFTCPKCGEISFLSMESSVKSNKGRRLPKSIGC